MNRDWAISFIGAVICHLGVFFGFQLTLSKPAQILQPDAVEVMLIAAPAPVAPKPVEIIQPVKPPPPVPPPRVQAPPPVQPRPEEIILPKPVESPQPVATPTPPPAKLIVEAPPTNAPVVFGDASSARPGKDATTTPRQPEVRAAPNYRKNPEPLYPAAARRRREQGLVLLTVKVTAQGRAANVELKQTSGFPTLDDAALRAVREWEFEPARLGGLPVDSQIEVPVRYQLSQ